MNKLKFESSLIGTRFSSDFFLPDFLRDESGLPSRKKMLEKIQYEEYGFIDDEGLTFDVRDVTDNIMDVYIGNLVGGKAKHHKLEFTLKKNGRSHSFTIDLFDPIREDNPPLVIYPNFKKEVPNKHLPLEELLDNGLMVCHIYYQDITSDDFDMSNGASALLINPQFERPAGKIAVWSYCVRLVMHYLKDNGFARGDKTYIAGHSRLGKTALLTLAMDEGFNGGFINNSGCGGAAIFKEKRGERIDRITEVFGYWFTPSFKEYAGLDEKLDFDQHFLIASAFPRKVMVVAAGNDEWADTDAQYIACEAASIAYAERGVMGMEKKDIVLGDKNDSGSIKFYKRPGDHFFLRDDWHFYIESIKKEN